MKDKEFLVRAISGIAIVTILLKFIYSLNIVFDFCFIFIIGLFMAFEWANITSSSNNKTKWAFLGILYISITLLPLLILKHMYNGNHLLMWLFLIVWCTDTFAYIFGAKLGLGKHKINKISPKKSYEGLIAGTIASMIFGYIFCCFMLPEYKNLLLYFTPTFCCLEQASDFTESYIKRKFNIKDSGNIIPGHGGFLDRFDGFLYITIVLLYLLNFS